MYESIYDSGRLPDLLGEVLVCDWPFSTCVTRINVLKTEFIRTDFYKLNLLELNLDH